MRNHTCLLDHHQRSHYVTIGPEVKFHWVLQLINNQKEKLFNSHEEKFNTQRSPNQPDQSQNQSVIDREKPDNTQDVFVAKGETSRFQEINEKCFHEELCSSDRSGQPDKHTIKRQDAPGVHREIALLNTDNELIRERIDEDIDFKIPGLPHSTVKQLHSASVREVIQKIENHPHRHALQRDLQQSQSFNPFSQEPKQMIHQVGNIELCELLDTEPKAQCKVCLSYWDVGIV